MDNRRPRKPTRPSLRPNCTRVAGRVRARSRAADRAAPPRHPDRACRGHRDRPACRGIAREDLGGPVAGGPLENRPRRRGLVRGRMHGQRRGDVGLGLLWWRCLQLFGSFPRCPRLWRGTSAASWASTCPGGVWAVLGRGELARRGGASAAAPPTRPPSISYGCMCVAAAVSAACSPRSRRRTGEGLGWGWLLLRAGPASASLAVHPAVLGRMLAAGRRITRGRVDLVAPPWPAMLRLIGWAIADVAAGRRRRDAGHRVRSASIRSRRGSRSPRSRHGSSGSSRSRSRPAPGCAKSCSSSSAGCRRGPATAVAAIARAAARRGRRRRRRWPGSGTT